MEVYLLRRKAVRGNLIPLRRHLKAWSIRKEIVGKRWHVFRVTARRWETIRKWIGQEWGKILFGSSWMARRRSNFFGRRIIRGRSNLSEEGQLEDRRPSEALFTEDCRFWKPRVRKVRNPLWLLAKQTGGRCFREARTYIWCLTTATRRSLARSFARIFTVNLS